MLIARSLNVSAAFIALRSIVIVDLLGIEKLTNAFGLTALFQGIVALAGAPISGKFPYILQSYLHTYIYTHIRV